MCGSWVSGLTHTHTHPACPCVLQIFTEIGAVQSLKRIVCYSSNGTTSTLAKRALSTMGEEVPRRLLPSVPNWKPPEVQKWLQQIGFAQHCPKFLVGTPVPPGWVGGPTGGFSIPWAFVGPSHTRTPPHTHTPISSCHHKSHHSCAPLTAKAMLRMGVSDNLKGPSLGGG